MEQPIEELSAEEQARRDTVNSVRSNVKTYSTFNEPTVEEGPGFGTKLGAAFVENTFAGNLGYGAADVMLSIAYAPDDNFAWDKERLGRMPSYFSGEAREYVMEAQSDEELDKRIDVASGQMDRQLILEQMDIPDTLLYNTIGIVLDPSTWLMGAGAVKATATAVRLGANRLAAASVATGVEGALYEVPRATFNAYGNKTDVAISAAVGFSLPIIGSKVIAPLYRKAVGKHNDYNKELVDYLVSGEPEKALEELDKGLTTNTIGDGIPLDLTPDGGALKASSLETKLPDGEDIPTVDLTQNDTSVGAAAVKGERVEVSFTDDEVGDLLQTSVNRMNANALDFDEQIGGRTKKLRDKLIERTSFTRTSAIAKAATKHNSIAAEWLVKAIGSDATGVNTVGVTASAESVVLKNQFSEAIPKVQDLANKAMAREAEKLGKAGQTGSRVWQEITVKRQKFMEDLVDFQNKVYLHGGRGTTDTPAFKKFMDEADPLIKEAAKHMDDSSRAAFDAKKAAGVYGYKNLEWRAGYVQRSLSNEALNRMSMYQPEFGKMFGQQFKNIAKASSKAKLSRLNVNLAKLVNDKTEAELLMTAGGTKALNDNLLKVQKINGEVIDLKAKIANLKQGGVEAETVEGIAKYNKIGTKFMQNMVDNMQGFTSDIDSLLSVASVKDLTAMLGNKQDAQDIFDALTELGREQTKSNRTKSRINFDMETSITATDGKKLKLGDIYSKDAPTLMSRLAKESGGEVALARAGIKSKSDYDKVVNHMVKEIQSNTKGTTTVELRRLKMHAEDLYATMLSKPVSNAMHSNARRVKELTTIMMLDKTGIAQVADSAIMMANHGAVKTLHEVAGYLPMIKSLQNGTASRKLMSDIESLAGGGFVGKDHTLNAPSVSRIGETAGADVPGKAGRVIDDALANGVHQTMRINFMNAVSEFQQKVSTVLATKDTVRDILDGKNLSRLQAMGVDKQIVATIKSEAKKGTLVFGKHGGLLDTNYDHWTSKRQAAKFTAIIRTTVDTEVQKSRPGEEIPFTEGNLGGIMTSLQNFALLAHHKQTLRAIHHSDQKSLALAAWSAMMGALVYTANDQLNHLNDDDYSMEDTMSKVVAGQFNYSPIAGILPEVVNTAALLPVLSEFVPQEWTPAGASRGKTGVAGGRGGNDVADLIKISPVSSAINDAFAPFIEGAKIVKGDSTEESRERTMKALPWGNSVQAILARKAFK